MKQTFLVVLWFVVILFAKEWEDYFVIPLEANEDQNSADFFEREFGISSYCACIASLKKTIDVEIDGRCYYSYSMNAKENRSFWLPNWVAAALLKRDSNSRKDNYRFASDTIRFLKTKDSLDSHDSVLIDSLENLISKKWFPDYQENLDEYSSVASFPIGHELFSCRRYDYDENGYVDESKNFPIDSMVFLFKSTNPYYAVCKLYNYECYTNLVQCLFNDEKWPSKESFPTEKPSIKIHYTPTGPGAISKKVNLNSMQNDKTMQYKANGVPFKNDGSNIFFEKNHGFRYLKK